MAVPLRSSKNAVILPSVRRRLKHGRYKYKNMPKMWAHFIRKSIWTTQYHSLIRYTLDVLSEQHKSIPEL